MNSGDEIKAVLKLKGMEDTGSARIITPRMVRNNTEGAGRGTIQYNKTIINLNLILSSSLFCAVLLASY